MNWAKNIKMGHVGGSFFEKTHIKWSNNAMKSSVCQSVLHIHLKCLCKFSKQLGGWEAALVGAEAEGAGAKAPREPAWGGRGQACAECKTFSLPLQRTGAPWLHRHQSTELRAQSKSEWWKPSASFNLKLLGWSWHPHKNNTYYVVCIWSHSPGWLNDNSYLTEHWKLLLHHVVDLSITNSLLGK